MDANASLNSVKALQAEVVAAIDCAAREQVQKLDEQDDDEPEPPADAGGAAAPQRQVGKSFKANRQFRSTTDPDATLVRHSGLKSRPRYKTHRVVDDAHEIITALETTTGAVDEGQRLLELIQAHEEVTQQQVQTVIADARYGTTRNLLGCQALGIRPHLAVLAKIQTSAGQRAKIYSERMFLYQPQSNTYLRRDGRENDRRNRPGRVVTRKDDSRSHFTGDSQVDDKNFSRRGIHWIRYE